ncbi:MAG: DNA polymerase [Armatimonadota bacterium]|nr:DNA polymerase [Armatimonadota bacterium]
MATRGRKAEPLGRAQLVLPTLHPAAVLRAGGAGDGSLYRELVIRDLRLARELADGGRVLDCPEGVPSPGSALAVDTEWDGQELLAVAVAREQAAVVDRETFARLTETTPLLLGYNIPGDLDQLIAHGWLPPLDSYVSGRGILDVMLVARMAEERLPKYDLESVAASLLPDPVPAWKAQTRARYVRTWSREELERRCRWDAWITWKLGRLLARRVSRRLVEYTQRVAMVLHRATLAGVIVSRKAFEALRAETAARVEGLQRRLVELSVRSGGPSDFTPTRGRQVRDLLFGRLGLVPVGYTASGEPQVTRDALRRLRESAEPAAVEVIDALLDWSQAAKLHSTYAAGLERHLRPLPDGRLWLQFHFRALGARTGRRSAAAPNSQNWPRQVRGLVVSRWPGGQIVEADLRRLEAVIVAWLAGDEELMRVYADGGGYIEVARQLLGRELTEDDPQYRNVKGVILGVHYNMGPEHMAEQLWARGLRLADPYEAHERETVRLHRAYLEAFPRLRRYMRLMAAERERLGRVVSVTGRVRRLVGTGKHVENQAINYPVQSLAADVMAAILIDLEERILAEAGWGLGLWHARLLEEARRAERGELPDWPEVPTIVNEVHDSVLVDCPGAWVERLRGLLEAAVEERRPLRELAPSTASLPIRAKVTVSPCWGG